MQAILKSEADYVFASKLNPRYTSESFNGLQAVNYFNNISDVVWTRHHVDNNEVSSTLLKIDRKAIEKRLSDLKG